MNRKSFSLIELLVVTSIIGLLTVIILPYFRAGERQFALQRATNKLAQDVRRAQNMAISAQEFEGEIPGGYGVYFDTGQPKQYILFADENDDKDYDDGEEVEILELEKMIVIHALSPSQPLNIVFSPPDPQVSISGGATAVVTLALEKDLSLTQSVAINKAGLVNVVEPAAGSPPPPACGGWMNAGYCWYNGGSGQDCNAVCASHGGVYGGNCDWVNDPTDCSTCRYWYPGATCYGSSSYGPRYRTTYNRCYYHWDGGTNCAGTSGYMRQCACNN